MSATLQKVMEIQALRAKAADDAFRSLVKQLVADDKKPPKPEQIDEILRAANKTLAELQEAIDVATHRKELRAIVMEANKAASQLDDINAAIKAADDELSEANRRHSEKVIPLRFRRDEISQLQTSAASARSELIRSIDGDDRQEIDQVRSVMDNAEAALTSARRRLEFVRARTRTRLPNANDSWRPAGELIKLADPTFEDDVKEAESEVEKARRVLDESVRRQDELIAAAIER